MSFSSPYFDAQSPSSMTYSNEAEESRYENKLDPGAKTVISALYFMSDMSRMC